MINNVIETVQETPYLFQVFTEGIPPTGIYEHAIDGNTPYSSTALIEKAFVYALGSVFRLFEPSTTAVILAATLDKDTDLLRARQSSGDNRIKFPIALAAQNSTRMIYSASSNVRKYVGTSENLKSSDGKIKTNKLGFLFRPVEMDWTIRFYSFNNAIMKRYIEGIYMNGPIVNKKFQYTIPYIPDEVFEGTWIPHVEEDMKPNAINLQEFSDQGQLWYVDFKTTVYASLVSKPAVSPIVSQVIVKFSITE